MYINLIGVNLWLPNLVRREYFYGFTKGGQFNSLLFINFYKIPTVWIWVCFTGRSS